MKPVISIIFAQLLITVVSIQLTSCSDSRTVLQKGSQAPGFKLQALDGKSYEFPHDFKNHVTLLTFWADWCPLCKQEMADFEILYRRYHQRGLSVVAVNIAQDIDTALAFIEDIDPGYPILLDSDGQVTELYAISSLPVAMVIDRQGRLQTRILGETSIDVFDQAIGSLL